MKGPIVLGSPGDIYCQEYIVTLTPELLLHKGDSQIPYIKLKQTRLKIK